MHRFPRVSASRLFAAGLCACLAIPALAQISVRAVKVLGSRDTVEIEVEASDRIIPQAQVLTGPDRLVVDFPNSLPSRQIRNQSVDRGDVKDVRVGLFQSTPPVTRVVIDLKTARSYQIFPYGRTVMIKVMGEAIHATASSGFDANTGHPGLVAANYTTRVEPVSGSMPSPLEVSFHDGLLGIHANKVTLSQVLFAVQQSTRAEIAIPAGAEQETVVAEIPPAPAPEVLAQLLNGSKFNFLILSGPQDPRQLDRVILSARNEGTYEPAPAQPMPDPSVDEESVPASGPPSNRTAVPDLSSGQPQADLEPDALNK
jgi:hypothetical protein